MTTPITQLSPETVKFLKDVTKILGPEIVYVQPYTIIILVVYLIWQVLGDHVSRWIAVTMGAVPILGLFAGPLMDWAAKRDVAAGRVKNDLGILQTSLLTQLHGFYTQTIRIWDRVLETEGRLASGMGAWGQQLRWDIAAIPQAVRSAMGLPLNALSLFVASTVTLARDWLGARLKEAEGRLASHLGATDASLHQAISASQQAVQQQVLQNTNVIDRSIATAAQAVETQVKTTGTEIKQAILPMADEVAGIKDFSMPLAGALATGVLSMGGLGSLLSTAVGTLTDQTHSKRVACLPTTGQALFNILKSSALPIAGVLAYKEIPMFSDWVDSIAGKGFDFWLEPLVAQAPITPEKAAGVAPTLFANAMLAGVGAHVASSLAETFAPLKNLGLSYIAAFLADMGAFSTIAQATIGAAVGLGLRQPFTYHLNQQLRPRLPEQRDAMDLMRRNFIDRATFNSLMAYQGLSDGWTETLSKLAKTYPGMSDLEMMYAKKEASPEQFTRWMRAWGYDDEMLEVYRRYLWLDPRLSELIRIAQLFRPPTHPEPEAVEWLRRAGIPLTDPDAWWFTYKIAKAGYEPIDIPILTEVAKLGVVRREQTLFFEAGRRLYRDGYIDNRRVRELTETAWVAKPPVDYRIMATELDREYAIKEETVQLTLSAFTRGILGEAEAIGIMADLGMDGQRIALRIMRAKLGLIAPVRIEVPREEEIVFAGD